MQDHHETLPGLRKSVRSPSQRSVRILLADGGGWLREQLGRHIADRHERLATIHVPSVPAAVEALLVRHPDVVVTSLDLPGHAQRGFRVVLDAVSLGVPTIAVGSSISPGLRRRLRELGVSWVHRGSSNTLIGAFDRAMDLTSPSMDLASPSMDLASPSVPEAAVARRVRVARA